MGKYLIGAFWQPVVVIADIACLESLPKNHLINGLVEVIKIFLTHDAHSFNKLSRDLDAILDGNSELLIDLIKQSITLKLRVVKNDEREEGERVVLNWGHTIGHALEQLSNYQLLHGYAVGLGLLVEAKIAVLMGFLSASAFDVIQSTLKRLSIFARDLNNYSLDAVIRQTHGDKKRRSKRVYYVLLSELGQVYLENNQFAHPVPDAVIRQAYLELMKG
jgi:3-dehydroquinate synthase